MVWCRKNQSTLTSTEKARFVAAVLALKASGAYDTYVQQHMNFMSSAHRASAFPCRGIASTCDGSSSTFEPSTPR